MERIDIPNLATGYGRNVYQEYYRELLVDGRGMVLPSLWRLWRSAAFGTEIHLPAPAERTYRIGHPLGLRAGTRLFMEEVVIRHYFNNIQALVYLGATILLVFLGLRFAGILSETVALIGIGIEAVMLLVLFVALFYTPEDEAPATHDGQISAQGAPAETGDREVISEVLEELEQIGSSYASIGLKLEQSATAQEHHLRELAERVGNIQGLDNLNTHTQQLDVTNELLRQLTTQIEAMNKRIDLLFGREIEFHVRRELESIMNRGLNGASNLAGPPAAANQAQSAEEPYQGKG